MVFTSYFKVSKEDDICKSIDHIQELTKDEKNLAGDFFNVLICSDYERNLKAVKAHKLINAMPNILWKILIIYQHMLGKAIDHM